MELCAQRDAAALACAQRTPWTLALLSAATALLFTQHPRALVHTIAAISFVIALFTLVDSTVCVANSLFEPYSSRADCRHDSAEASRAIAHVVVGWIVGFFLFLAMVYRVFEPTCPPPVHRRRDVDWPLAMEAIEKV